MKRIFLFLLLLVASRATTAPHIKQWFPDQTFLIGKPGYWLIQIRHPLWERYELKIVPVTGLEMRVDSRHSRIEKNDIITTYRLALVAEDISIARTPAVVFLDTAGRSTAITGKSIRVQLVSGPSLDIKNPSCVSFTGSPAKHWKPEYGFLLLIPLLVVSLYFVRRHQNDPRKKFLRRLKRLAKESEENLTQQMHTVSKLLRSPFLWGFPAEACTPAELREKTTDCRLVMIATTLEAMEYHRYSQTHPAPLPLSIRESISAALHLMQGRQNS